MHHALLGLRLGLGLGLGSRVGVRVRVMTSFRFPVVLCVSVRAKVSFAMDRLNEASLIKYVHESEADRPNLTHRGQIFFGLWGLSNFL